jgi:ATP-GRASP peptide maturase of grasp-with-spasm system
MILILSSQKDGVTQTVCRWLSHQKKVFCVLHFEDKLTIEKISNEACIVSFRDQNEHLNLKSVTSYWYRRDNFSFGNPYSHANHLFSDFVQINSDSDEITVLQFMHFLLLEKRSIGSVFKSNVNKLEILHLATQENLATPSYIYTGKKSELLAFCQRYDNVIFKTPSPGILDPFNEIDVLSYTQKVSDQILNDLSSKFGLTFFQNQIEKKYEIRTFYLNGELFSIAMLSQLNEKTATDYRNYDAEKPNRSLPYLLPASVSSNLKRLIKKLKLDCCSVDFIVSPTNEHYFLEINPIGQFGNVSHHRNDFLEREIATILN